MTIEEAIKHSKEVAKNQECTECGKTHLQLAAWLEELIMLRFKVERLEKATEVKATDNSGWEFNDGGAELRRSQFFGEFS